MNEIPEVDDDLLSSIKIYNISLKKDGDSAVISFIDAADMNDKKKVEIKLSIDKQGRINVSFKCVDGKNQLIQKTKLFWPFFTKDFVFMSIFNICFSGEINDMTEDLKKKVYVVFNTHYLHSITFNFRRCRKLSIIIFSGFHCFSR